MATNFPTSVDDASTVGDDTHPSADELLSSTDGGPAHHALHQNVGLAINAIEDKVGTGASTPVVGSVLTGTGSGTSAWSTDPLSVDATNSRVGIGITSPETPLHIVTPNTLGTSFTGTTDGEGLRVEQSNYTADNYVSLVEGSYDDSQTAPHVRMGAQFTSGGSKMIFGTSNSYGSGITNTALTIDLDGDIGIGTTSPESILHLNPGTNLTPDANGVGHIMIDGDAYTSFFTMDATGTWIGNNSNGRSMILATDETARLTVSGTGAVTIAGSLSKGSGSFRIPHPLPAKAETHHLVHSFVEAPRADLIYRGQVALVDGAATVDLDEAAGMTTGTFELLNRDLQCFIVNNEGWTAVRGSVSGSTLTIEAQDASCADTVDWLVVGERQDQHMYDTEWTDDDGRVIVEPLVPSSPEPETM